LFATFCLIFGTEPYLVSKGCLYEVRRRAPRINQHRVREKSHLYAFLKV
jgi:hypothetical protein